AINIGFRFYLRRRGDNNIIGRYINPGRPRLNGAVGGLAGGALAGWLLAQAQLDHSFLRLSPVPVYLWTIFCTLTSGASLGWFTASFLSWEQRRQAEAFDESRWFGPRRFLAACIGGLVAGIVVGAPIAFISNFMMSDFVQVEFILHATAKSLVVI